VKIKPVFATIIQDQRLPQFHISYAEGSVADKQVNEIPSAFQPEFFNDDPHSDLLDREALLEGFRLTHCDAHVAFDDVNAELYQVDIEQVAQGDYSPQFKKVDPIRRKRFMDLVRSLEGRARISALGKRLVELIGPRPEVSERELLAYVCRILDGMEPEKLDDCIERSEQYARRIKDKIDLLETDYRMKKFEEFLMTERVFLKPTFSFPKAIQPAGVRSSGITGCLYMEEGDMNGFEQKFINEVANLPTVHFWHRNIERKGFRINGFINHYPDFLVWTKSGRIVVVETKGDDRDNTDSQRKLKLGRAWADKAGSGYRLRHM